MVEYDERLAVDTERGYMMPEIVMTRARTMTALQIQAGERVLDVGCGMGLMTREVALAVGPEGRVVGVDSSEPMLSLARRRCADQPHVELVNSSATTLEMPDDSFDVVVCMQLLLYLPDVVAALREFRRVLGPAGRIAIIETDWRSTLLNASDQETTRHLLDSWEASVASPTSEISPGQNGSHCTCAPVIGSVRMRLSTP